MKFDTQPEGGQTLTEYAVVLAVITILIIGAIGGLSTQISGFLNVVAGAI
jgi:Flp pilus assembly pilin Flp